MGRGGVGRATWEHYSCFVSSLLWNGLPGLIREEPKDCQTLERKLGVVRDRYWRTGGSAFSRTGPLYVTSEVPAVFIVSCKAYEAGAPFRPLVYIPSH